MSCDEWLDPSSLQVRSLCTLILQYQQTKFVQKTIWSFVVFLNSLGIQNWPIYTTCKFIYVWYGTGYNFSHWSPTLSGLMLMLSVPVLTRSPSRLQFLLAIATRLPFWLGPADLKHGVTLFGLDQHSEYLWNFQILRWPSGAACVLLEHAQTLTNAHTMRARRHADSFLHD